MAGGQRFCNDLCGHESMLDVGKLLTLAIHETGYPNRNRCDRYADA